MARVTTDNQHYSDIADAIRAKGVSGTFYPSEMATAISNIPTGSPGIPESGVVFVDYDGTLVTAWDASEVAGKTALPSNPTGHTRLVAEGWNWTLANIQSYMSANPEAVLTVGQTYHTVSGYNEYDIEVTPATGLGIYVGPYGSSKDWGDGTSSTSTNHTYSTYGTYTVKTSDTTVPRYLFGSSPSTCCVAAFLKSGVTQISQQAFYNCYYLRSVSVPNTITQMGTEVFRSCSSLVAFCIPSGVTTLDTGVFQACATLEAVSIPASVTTMHNNIFSSCYKLKSVALPAGYNAAISSQLFYSCYSLENLIITYGGTSVGSYAFSNCASLKSITFKWGIVSSVEAYAFERCYNVLRYDFTHLSLQVPTLAATSAFNNINPAAKIIVPDSLYDSWIAATNWSTYANYIYKASEVTD